MVDPDKIRGDVGRSFSPEPEREQQVDPNKFKRVMKVEETDPSGKREQRRLKKEDEEGEDDDEVQEKAPPPPTSSFAEFMEDKDELDGLFDAQSGGVQKRAAPQTEMMAPAPGSISTEGVESEEEPSTSQPSPYQPQPSPSPESEPEPSYQAGTGAEAEMPKEGFYPGEIQEPSSQQQTSSESQESPPSEQTPAPTQSSESQDQDTGEQPPEKKKEEDTSLLASQPALGALKSKKKPPKKPAARIETVEPHPKPLPEGKEEPHPLPKAGEESLVPTFEGAPTPPAEKKGGKVAEKPLEAPYVPEGKLPEKHKGPEEETGAISEKETKKAPALPKEAIQPPEAPIEGGLPPRPSTKVTFERFTPDQIREKKLGRKPQASGEVAAIEGMPVPGLDEGEMGMMGEGKKEKKDDFPFVDAEALSAALPTMEQPLPPITPPADVPAYSKLSPEIYEMFEKMVGTIIIQNHSGITSTTVTLNMPHSVFDGAQIIFDRYSTAPNSFNVQLIGTSQAVNIFTANMADLAAAFKQGEHAFEVNLLKPALAEKKPLIRRKSSAGGGSGEDKGKQ